MMDVQFAEGKFLTAMKSLCHQILNYTKKNDLCVQSEALICLWILKQGTHIDRQVLIASLLW